MESVASEFLPIEKYFGARCFLSRLPLYDQAISLPVKIITRSRRFSAKKTASPDSDCQNQDWRQKQNANKSTGGKFRPGCKKISSCRD
jgi:hypothetical protein